MANVDKGHRANGFTTDGGFAEYAINHVNTLVRVSDAMSDEEATLVVTAGTAMYGLTELGGLVAGESVVVTGPGPIGLLGVAVAKALGASPVILTGTRDNRLKIGLELGADHVINAKNEDPVAAVRKLNGGKGVDYVVECSGAPDAVNEAARMVIAAARSVSRRFRASRPKSISPTSCATTSTCSAFAAKARAPRTAPRRSWRRSVSTRPRSTPHTFCARGPSDRAALRPRAHRGCDQGRGQDPRPRRHQQRRGRVVGKPMLTCDSYLSPGSLGDALAAVAASDGRFRFVAGATDYCRGRAKGGPGMSTSR